MQQRVFTPYAPDVEIKPSLIPEAGNGVFGMKGFEEGEVWLVYGDVEMSEDGWCKASKNCLNCKGVLKDLYSCNNCNRTMDKINGVVSISTPFDLSGYLNHSSDPTQINFEKVKILLFKVVTLYFFSI